MKREVKIGVFAVAMILSMWAGIRFLSGIDIFSRNVDYYAYYEQVPGVQEAAPVLLRGVKIGTITEIKFDPATDSLVALRLTIKKKYRLPVDSRAKLASGSLMGGKEIQIEYGSSSEFLQSGDEILTETSGDMMQMALSELDFFKQKIGSLTDELTATLESVHGVVDDNANSIESLLWHLSSISTNIDHILTSEKEGLRGAVRGISEFSSTLGENAERMDQMMGNLALFSDKLANSDLVENLESTLGELNDVMAKIESGEGTLGHLLSDEELYTQLTDASTNLSALLADLKENPGRYVHISVFGANEERQAERAARKAEKQEQKRLKDSLRSVK